MDKKTQGIEATNRDFVRYDQVEKRQTYRLAESAGDAAEEFDDDYRIRTCDMGMLLRGDARDKQRFARDLGEALADIGFAILANTGIDPAMYDQAVDKTIELFTRPSAEEKLRFTAQRHGSVNQGYFPIKETSAIHPDLVEGWVFCRRAFAIPQPSPTPPVTAFWPRPQLEGFFRRLCQAHERLILPIMRSILTYLGAEPHAFDERLAMPNFGLRLNYYPPIADADERSGAGRLLGHEDVDLFTLLPAPHIEGLQILNRRNFKWIRIQAPRGTIVLNTGDYMQRISNDVLPSTTHRVAKPRDPALCQQPRVSFPTNVYLWEDELLEVLPGLGQPRYEPIKAIVFHTQTTSKYYGDDYAVTE